MSKIVQITMTPPGDGWMGAIVALSSDGRIYIKEMTSEGDYEEWEDISVEGQVETFFPSRKTIEERITHENENKEEKQVQESVHVQESSNRTLQAGAGQAPG